jgi:hypothetical protein
MSQILLQKSLNPQQLRSQNETLIAQIKASKLFVLRYLNHPSPPSVPGVQDQSYIQSSPPIPPSSKNDIQDQPVVSNKENVGHK